MGSLFRKLALKKIYDQSTSVNLDNLLFWPEFKTSSGTMWYTYKRICLTDKDKSVW